MQFLPALCMLYSCIYLNQMIGVSVLYRLPRVSKAHSAVHAIYVANVCFPFNIAYSYYIIHTQTSMAYNCTVATLL